MESVVFKMLNVNLFINIIYYCWTFLSKIYAIHLVILLELKHWMAFYHFYFLFCFTSNFTFFYYTIFLISSCQFQFLKANKRQNYRITDSLKQKTKKKEEMFYQFIKIKKQEKNQNKNHFY